MFMHAEVMELRDLLERDEKYGWRFINLQPADSTTARRGRSISVDLAIPYDDLEEEDDI